MIEMINKLKQTFKSEIYHDRFILDSDINEEINNTDYQMNVFINSIKEYNKRFKSYNKIKLMIIILLIIHLL